MIKYKLIEHERTQDAPFVGCLICADNCNLNCKNCFNQHLKDISSEESTAEILISEVMHNPLNRGIILGGLEWSYQMEDVRDLVTEARNNELEVIIYTGLTYGAFIDKLKAVDIDDSGIFIKSGRYEENLICHTRTAGIVLSSANQEVHYNGEKLT